MLYELQFVLTVILLFDPIFCSEGSGNKNSIVALNIKEQRFPQSLFFFFTFYMAQRLF